MRRLPLLPLLACCLFPHPVFAQSVVSSATLRDEDSRLMLLFAEDARREAETDPLERIYRGELADPDAFARLFTPELDRLARASTQQSLDALA